jgi:hypothetical protein
VRKAAGRCEKRAGSHLEKKRDSASSHVLIGTVGCGLLIVVVVSCGSGGGVRGVHRFPYSERDLVPFRERAKVHSLVAGTDLLGRRAATQSEDLSQGLTHTGLLRDVRVDAVEGIDLNFCVHFVF